MQGFPLKVNGALVAIFCLFGAFAFAEEAGPPITVVISVAEQKLAILNNGGLFKKYPISTSKFGIGDAFGSYKTPLGKLKVCDKIGDDLTAGAVLKARHATGEVLPVNAPGRDPIVTRILWLEGLETQNENARNRGIYIHGTVEESKIGEPVSYGCIRMRSKDVVEVFEEIPLDAEVTIIAEKFPRFPKYREPKPPVIAAAPVGKAAPSPAAPAKKPVQPAPAPIAVVQIATPAKPASILPAKATPAVVAQVPIPAKLAPPLPTEPPVHTMASLALQGSMLDAGLPQGPKILMPPTPAESGDAASNPVKPAPRIAFRGEAMDEKMKP